MPFGYSRNWFVGSLFILALIAVAARSVAAEQSPSGEMPQTAPVESAEQGVQEGAKTESTPSHPTSTTVEEEECGSFCGMPLCSPPGRFWLRADALVWWTNGTRLPALATSNSSGNPPILGQPGTQVVFGNETYLNDGRGGVRMTLGGWLDRCHRWGIEADWFTIAGHSFDYTNFSNGNPATGRPFFNMQTNQESAEIVAQGTISGSVNVNGGDSFDSAGFLLRYNLCCGGGCGSCSGEGDVCNLDDCCGLCLNYCRADLLIGYRNYRYRDGLTIHESLDDRTPGFDRHFEIQDNFRTRNEFNGAEIGLNTELRRGRWSLNILTKMALGSNRQITDINGSTAISNIDGSGTPLFFPVGIYAVNPNSGTYQKDTFVMIPQLGLELGYQVTCRTRAYIGYNLLYWGNVLRAGDQIDQNIDPRNWANVPPQTAAQALPFPQYPDRCSAFWAQGINLGLEVRF
ncbi:MAG: BBP7 family outer membrane beta-barrel protein [Pirellulales bacterium]|nr:BBP7 family outer membrane beta-barrel protein [Pirellulales bacterium]